MYNAIYVAEEELVIDDKVYAKKGDQVQIHALNSDINEYIIKGPRQKKYFCVPYHSIKNIMIA